LTKFEKIEKHNPAGMESIDIDTLKRSCKANGLSDQGTKAELWGRLKCGSGADKKKAKKPAPPATDAGPPPSYVAKEYASLKAAGFDDEKEINDLINKRWKKAQELSVESKGEIVKPTKNVIEEEVHIPVFLTEAQAAKSNLQINLKDPQPNDKGMYTYTRISGSAAKYPKEEDIKPKTKAVRTAQAALAEAVKITSPSAETDAAPKRKCNFEEMDGFHEAAISWTSKTIENRLMDKKRQKQNLVNLCPDFNIPVLEDTKKRQIAQELARNLLHYTDDEEE